MQFLPQDPRKVLVSCADSHVKIIDGINVVGKYKGMFLKHFIHFRDNYKKVMGSGNQFYRRSSLQWLLKTCPFIVFTSFGSYPYILCGDLFEELYFFDNIH